MISVVLVSPSRPGNIGSIARSMKNFGLKDLILIDPGCSIEDDECKKRAMHAKDILGSAKIRKISCLKRFHTVIATTSKIGTDYNIPRSPITPDQLSDILPSRTRKKIAVVFGTEDRGLTNEELALADFIVAIPTSRRYPALNLSHAAAIIFYELSKKKENISSHITLASKVEKDQIEKNISNILDKINFSTASKKNTQKVIWKRILGKSFLTKREAYALLGFFKKLR